MTVNNCLQPTYGDIDLTALLGLVSIIKEQEDSHSVSECQHHEEMIVYRLANKTTLNIILSLKVNCCFWIVEAFSTLSLHKLAGRWGSQL